MKTFTHTAPSPSFPCTFQQDQNEIAFFDIETTGLSAKASSLYLIGMMYYDKETDSWVICQWFADNYHSEKDILQAFLDKLENFSYLYHFNGKTFDIPYILEKCKKHSLTPSSHNKKILLDDTDIWSIDLLKHIRRLKTFLSLEKCNQTYMEHWLGIQRKDIFSGGDLIPVYSEYMQQKILSPQKAEQLEQVLLLHNYEDVKMMLELCSILTYEEYLSADCINRLLTGKQLDTLACEISRMVTLSLTLPTPLPKKIVWNGSFPSEEVLPDISITLSQNALTLCTPIYEGTMKYFFADYKNYYYLPQEDTAIHKSVAEFVDHSHRKRATATTCYTKKTGLFLPLLPLNKKKAQTVPEKLLSPPPEHFQFTYRDKCHFLALPKDYNSNPAFWQYYLAWQLTNVAF